ncbi:P-loop containing nucleoside triphosphate hydrolase protein [Anaeromyces robustus]|uniref:p-loop containing nucleoside triphosphate hydrolase protein n=1 Tax=Anaeromyces robustus TaxID=1754192 RepID=A0A1Y1X5H0_9FUNG|nr:P-loop containing nucleoside triphosphate hydrolase protein [Anaeromyces robustus]|eukprot:ORX80606.1 P-loop containing nucleoside triphosphate hydrolase protein [Anaeromyces robustus]
MEFKIPNKNKKKRKLTTSNNITNKRISKNDNSSNNVNITGNTTNNNYNNSGSSTSGKSITDNTILSVKNSLLNSPVIPNKLKKLYQLFQIINKYYTLKQSRNTELFIFDNYKTIIESELKCEVDPLELAQIAGISPNNFTLQYLPIGKTYISNKNEIISSQSLKKENIENHLIIKKEDDNNDNEIVPVVLIIHLEGNFKRLPRNQIILKYGQLLKERNDRVNNDFKLFYIKMKRSNKNLDEELAKFKLSPIYIKYLEDCKALTERSKKREEEDQMSRLIKKENSPNETNNEVSFREFIDNIKKLDFYEGQMVYEYIANPRLPKYGNKDISEYTHVLDMLRRVMGIEKLYSHQMKAIYQIWQGNNVVVTTYTSSGKSLIYQIPIIGALEKDKNAKALLIFPTKALTQDQYRSMKQKFQEMENLSWVVSNIYDGDTTTNYKVRKEIADTSHLIFTNPDMLHKSLLPHHRNWINFFKHLKFVVVDEIHSYTHAFGTHCALIMRRLRRICEFYGNTNIQFISCSATIENAKSHTEAFFNINNVVLINEDGSPSGLKYHLFWDPIQKQSNKLKSLIFDSDSSLVESGRLFMALLLNNSRCIVFCKTKKKCEILLEYIYKEIEKLTLPIYIGEKKYESYETLKQLIMGYRAGYSVNERREIESNLFHGYLKGVISTTALELGIDIGSLDAVIHLGFPFSVAGYFQQAGRVGRRGKEAVTILVAENGDIMDRYYINNPKEIFNKPLEYSIIYPYHDIYLRKHIQCAANEIPIILENETYYFGDYEFLKNICDEELIKNERNISNEKEKINLDNINKEEKKDYNSKHDIKKENNDNTEVIYYCHPRFKNKPERFFSIRNIEEKNVNIIDNNTRMVLETIETSRMRHYHEHAVFLFKGQSYQVIESNEERKYVIVNPVKLKYITRPANRKIVTINSVNKIIKISDKLETKYGGIRGKLNTTTTTTTTNNNNNNINNTNNTINIQTIIYGYYKLNPYTSRILSVEQLPNRSIFQNTYGFWIDIPFDLVSKIGLNEKEMILYSHGVHAIQHVMLYALPIIILNLNSSMDNVFQMNCSIPKVNSVENLRILLYERKGCGVLSETISRHIPYLLTKVLSIISECDCDNGCPNCIQTPDCYKKNQDLSKKYAIEILKCLCESCT